MDQRILQPGKGRFSSRGAVIWGLQKGGRLAGAVFPRMEKQTGDRVVCALVGREVGRARAQRPNSHAAV